MKRPWETVDFWKDAAERIISTYLFTFLALITIDGFELNWKTVGGAAIAAGLSTAKALIGAARSNSTTPVSLT